MSASMRSVQLNQTRWPGFHETFERHQSAVQLLLHLGPDKRKLFERVLVAPQGYSFNLFGHLRQPVEPGHIPGIQEQ